VRVRVVGAFRRCESCDTDLMRRQDAEAHRDRLQQEDQAHTYVVRERSPGDWEVVRLDLARRIANVRAEQGKPANPQTRKPANPPEDPRPSLIRQIPPYGPAA
jgi:hypothetical protein